MDLPPLVPCTDCELCDRVEGTKHQDEDVVGVCRKRPPVPDDRGGLGRWPWVRFQDSCAEGVRTARAQKAAEEKAKRRAAEDPDDEIPF